MITVRSVVAHTECGPFDERGEVELPPDSVSEHKIPWRTLRSATVTEISAQLPESNPILEHPTLLAGRSVSVRLQLGRLKPVGQILCLYQHKEWWMRPAWVEHFCDIPERTQLVLWKSAKAWHVMMPVFRHEMRVDIRGDGRVHNDLLLDVSTNQVDRVQLQGPLLVHRQSDRKVEDPYELIRGCAEWVMSQNGGLGRLWKQTLPESLRGFGWCTWDSLGTNVSEQAIIAKMEEFAAKHVPVSWVLIDDGWSQVENGKLTGFDADTTRFPQGLSHTIDVLKHDFGVRYVGVWQAFQGYWHGVDVDALAGKPESDDDWYEYYKQEYPYGDARVEDPKLLVSRSAFETLPNGMAIPTANPERAALFWRTWNTHLDGAGIDFVKVDSQGTLPVLTRGLESYASLGVRHDAVEYATNWIRHEDDNGDWEYAHLAVIHCMGMTPENYWQRCAEGVARTSDDFFPNIPESLAEHAIENAYCSLLIGCLCYCDWDMFWTRHPHARTHMLLRWISGGPIYCSDKLGETDSDLLAPLFDADGNLTHPDGVGVPVLDSLLADPVHGDVPLGIRNTFRGDEVLLFVGLNADAPQTAHIRATESPLTVFDPQTGERVHLSIGEDLALTLHYGECELRVLQTLT